MSLSPPKNVRFCEVVPSCEDASLKGAGPTSLDRGSRSREVAQGVLERYREAKGASSASGSTSAVEFSMLSGDTPLASRAQKTQRIGVSALGLRAKAQAQEARGLIALRQLLEAQEQLQNALLSLQQENIAVGGLGDLVEKSLRKRLQHLAETLAGLDRLLGLPPVVTKAPKDVEKTLIGSKMPRFDRRFLKVQQTLEKVLLRQQQQLFPSELDQLVQRRIDALKRTFFEGLKGGPFEPIGQQMMERASRAAELGLDGDSLS